ncbi:MAG TPA: hypothetical protein VK641_10260 [Terriglobales bacterium]|nr:hypothetical protein [Terriglobales bacterium]
MKRFALLLLIALPMAALAHEDGVAAAPYDEVWRRANQSLVIMGFTVISRDKDAGIINAEIATRAEADWFTKCPNGRGVIELYGFSVAILLNALDHESTGIRVAAQGLNTWQQVDHYGIFKKRYIANVVRCEGTSNGAAEKLVLSHITGSSS